MLGRLLQLMRLIINRPTVVEKFYYDFIIIIKQKMIPHVNAVGAEFSSRKHCFDPTVKQGHGK